MANSVTIEKVLANKFDFYLNGTYIMSDGSPGLSVVTGGYFHFKTRNGANILKKQNIVYTEITIVDTYGGTGVFDSFISINAVWVKLLELGYFDDISVIGGGSGVDRFVNLLDAFSFYGNNGKIPMVDESQLKLIPTTFYNINRLVDLSDVAISSMVENKFISVQNVGGQLKFVLADINGIVSTTNNTLKKIIFIAEEGETEITVDNSPNSIFLYKNGAWLIETKDYTYSGGVISLIKLSDDGLSYVPSPTSEGDYFEIIPLSNEVKKYPITATSDNQTEWLFGGNPAFADAYLNGGRLREGVDYTRTLFSTDNKITIINAYLIDNISIGDVLEVLTY